MPWDLSEKREVRRNWKQGGFTEEIACAKAWKREGKREKRGWGEEGRNEGREREDEALGEWEVVSLGWNLEF